MFLISRKLWETGLLFEEGIAPYSSILSSSYGTAVNCVSSVKFYWLKERNKTSLQAWDLLYMPVDILLLSSVSLIIHLALITHLNLNYNKVNAYTVLDVNTKAWKPHFLPWLTVWWSWLVHETKVTLAAFPGGLWVQDRGMSCREVLWRRSLRLRVLWGRRPTGPTHSGDHSSQGLLSQGGGLKPYKFILRKWQFMEKCFVRKAYGIKLLPQISW